MAISQVKTVSLTSAGPVDVNGGVPLNGEYTVQFVGDFNSTTVSIKTTLDQDEEYQTITDSSLSAVTFTSKTVVNLKLHGYVQLSATGGTPDIRVLFAPVSQS